MYYKKKQLTPRVLAGVEATPSIRNALASAHNVSRMTVWRWARDNDPQLSEPKSIRVIQKFISLPPDQSFTEVIEIGDKHLKQS
jgi:hypothetical protein